MSAIVIMNYIYDSPRQLVIVLEDILIPLAEEKVIAKYFEVLRKRTTLFLAQRDGVSPPFQPNIFTSSAASFRELFRRGGLRAHGAIMSHSRWGKLEALCEQSLTTTACSHTATKRRKHSRG